MGWRVPGDHVTSHEERARRGRVGEVDGCGAGMQARRSGGRVRASRRRGRRRRAGASGRTPARCASPTCDEETVAAVERQVRRAPPRARARGGTASASCAAMPRAAATTTRDDRVGEVSAARPAVDHGAGDAARARDRPRDARARACRRSSGRRWPGSTRLRGRRRRSWSSPARTGRCTSGRGALGPRIVDGGPVGGCTARGHRLRQYSEISSHRVKSPSGLRSQHPAEQLAADQAAHLGRVVEVVAARARR